GMSAASLKPAFSRTPCMYGNMPVRMLVCEGRVMTLWECAEVKTRPSDANRSRLGVVPRGLPSKLGASKRKVSIVMRTTSRASRLGGAGAGVDEVGAGAGPGASRRQPAAERRNPASNASAGHRKRLIPAGKPEGPPGIPGRALGEEARVRLEADPAAQPHDPGRLDLLDPVEVRILAEAVVEAVLADSLVPLQHGVVVRLVEVLDGRGERDLVEAVRAIDQEVEVVDVVVQERIHMVAEDARQCARHVVGLHPEVVGVGIPLPAEEVGADIEAVGRLVQGR